MGALAPAWHTALLVGLILAVAITGSVMQATGALAARSSVLNLSPAARIEGQYLPLLLVNWGLVGYVCRLFLARNTLPELLGRRWKGARRVAIDLGLAGALFALILLIEALAAPAFAPGRNASLSALLPSTEAERLTWVLVAFSVGFCEEVVYRGYLQRQLGALTGRTSVGIALSAILFGIAHAEQGAASAARVAGYGLAFGVLAHFRRSLLPGIVCHVAIDLMSTFSR